ncbi:toxin-antitoxin system TumE family protein [Caldimonas sp. KR1-144]|uniref:toxin-antitoxin system TumE family protein n=1 Tax=Caldimonas sp. KR1-144 TaxID=3400911 RepID=UPI003C012A81
MVDGVCVVRYDDEVGKGDHRHFGEQESKVSFTTPEALLAAFERDIARWNRENSDS